MEAVALDISGGDEERMRFNSRYSKSFQRKRSHGVERARFAFSSNLAISRGLVIGDLRSVSSTDFVVRSSQCDWRNQSKGKESNWGRTGRIGDTVTN